MSKEQKTSLESQQQDSISETEQNKENYLNKEIVSREKIEDSPFELVKWENKWFIAMGKQKLTPEFDTDVEALQAMETWDFKTTVMIVIAESINRYNELMKQDLSEVNGIKN